MTEDIIEDFMRIAKWGNSLAVRLPKKLIEEMGLKEGDEVGVETGGARRIAIVPDADQRAFRDKLRALQEPTPKGFRWNREDANKR
jgi:antitoxin MazE